MLTPDYYESFDSELNDLIHKLEDDIISDIVRRIVKSGKITATADYQLKILLDSGRIYDDILTEIAEKSGATESEMRKIFEESGTRTVESDNEIYRENGLETVGIKDSEKMKKSLEKGWRRTVKNVKNLTLTTADTSQSAYINACNSAYAQVASGAFSYNQAIKNAVGKVAEDGAVVRYPSGHTERIDVAVRRAVLTGVRTTARDISLLNAEEAGCDLMEISAHSGARPSHAKWQGKIVSLSGKKGYLSKRDIGYGTGDGFGGWNCRHDWFPFFGGRSKRNYTEKDLRKFDEKSIDYNGQKYSQYEISQIQRKMERGIRSAKREKIAFQTAVDECDDPETKRILQESLDGAERKLAEKQRKMREFVSQTGQNRDYYREQIYSDKPTKNNSGKGLTSDKNSDKIIIASNAHPRNIELEKTIKKCIKQDKPVFDDNLAKYFPRIKPEKDRYIMSLHGNPNETYIYDKKIDARTLANIIKSRKDYNNEEIILISCHTGNTEHTKNCFAQQFADEMGVTVHAPTSYGVINIFGQYYSGTRKGKREGKFKSFEPRTKE